MKHLIFTKLFTSLLALFITMSVFSQSNSLNSIDYANETVGTVVGDMGLIMRTTDGGLTFAAQNSGTQDNLNCVEMIDVNTIIAVGENGIILMSTDGGTSWVFKDSKTIEVLECVTYFGTSNLIASGQNGTLIKSIDSGENWDFVTISSRSNLCYVYFYNENLGFAVGSEGTVIRTSDGGNTFEVITVGGGVLNINSIYMIDELNGILVGQSGLIMHTNDGGIFWELIQSPLFTENFNDVVFNYVTSAIPWALTVGNYGQIAISIDGGYTWNGVASPVTKNFKRVIFTSPTHGNIISDSTILISEDGGNSWLASNIFSGTNNMNQYKNLSVKEDNKVQVSQNYPNPFNPSTVISYQLPFDAQVSVKVFDMAGREVADLTNAHQSTGSYSVTFDASSLASGVYFYKVSAQSNSQKFEKTMKMLLIK